MKKSFLVLTLVGILTVGGSVMAFADDTKVNSENNNAKTKIETLMEEGASFEEAKSTMLKSKLERVDEALKNRTITQERADEIKTEITERVGNCTTPGENKGEKPKYGLNKNMKQNGNGIGKGNGNKNGAGMGSKGGQCINN